MSKEESPSLIIKSEPCNDDVHYIDDKIKVENFFSDEAKTQVDLEYIKEESLMEVKQEEIFIKNEIPCGSDTQNNLPDDNVVFTVDFELSPTALNTETGISTGEKRFACTFCQYKTSRRWNLKQHIDCHTREKPCNEMFRCSECEYETPRKNAFIRHLVVHTGEKRFACNLCEFKTAQKGNLKRHMLTHTGEKPFACNLCELRTAEKSKLKRHMLTHTDEKPFSCNLCEFKFAQKSSLKLHIIKRHKSNKPFSGNFCEFKEDIKVDESSIEMKQEEITINNEIPSWFDTQHH